MVKQLSPSELAGAIFIALGVTLAGIVMAVSGGSDPLGIHGMMIALYAGALLLVLFTASSGPEPTEDREASYYDDPIKVGIALVDGVGGVRHVHGRLGGGAARVARSRVRCRLVELRPASARRTRRA